MTDLPKPFYADDDMCFWCHEKYTTDYMGVPLCEKHAAEELAKDMQWPTSSHEPKDKT